MTLRELTPLQEAVHQMDETIRQLQLQRAALAAHIPVEEKDRRQGPATILNPRTGKYEVIKPSKGCR
ncbi:MAG: hypothetical protein H8E41_11005 [Desulfobulbaceae bacterium]|uniref:Uncharacterized protein n=1 Tax=Candidatus Desulfobia pelagia TaxID=2841692 RepID=A0A8J6TCT0_9BACT|nr:hypothetical protein [Candidatus Desulfobia pelagia]